MSSLFHSLQSSDVLYVGTSEIFQFMSENVGSGHISREVFIFFICKMNGLALGVLSGSSYFQNNVVL